MNPNLHEVAITAIVVKDLPAPGEGQADGKYLITRRSPNKKRFPGMWTVPGGKLEKDDYLKMEKDTEHYWYNVLERTLRREVKEEVGIDIANVDYLTSLATVHADGAPSLVISCVADYAGGEVKLQEGETDEYAWVTSEEAKNYQLIDGILDELIMADKKLTGARAEWARASKQITNN